MISKLHHWFKSAGNFAEYGVFAYWWSCIRKGLRLQPGQQTFFLYCLNPHNTKDPPFSDTIYVVVMLLCQEHSITSYLVNRTINKKKPWHTYLNSRLFPQVNKLRWINVKKIGYDLLEKCLTILTTKPCMCILHSTQGLPSFSVRNSQTTPSWILKRAGLESSGWRIIFSTGKSKKIAFYIYIFLFKKILAKKREEERRRKKKKKMSFWDFSIFFSQDLAGPESFFRIAYS